MKKKSKQRRDAKPPPLTAVQIHQVLEGKESKASKIPIPPQNYLDLEKILGWDHSAEALRHFHYHYEHQPYVKHLGNLLIHFWQALHGQRTVKPPWGPIHGKVARKIKTQ